MPITAKETVSSIQWNNWYFFLYKQKFWPYSGTDGFSRWIQVFFDPFHIYRVLRSRSGCSWANCISGEWKLQLLLIYIAKHSMTLQKREKISRDIFGQIGQRKQRHQICCHSLSYCIRKTHTAALYCCNYFSIFHSNYFSVI